MKLHKLLLASACALTLCGCGTPKSISHYGIQNRDTAYLKARSIAPTTIPPGLVSNGFRNYYPVSLRHYPDSEKEVSTIPPGLKGSA